MKSTREFVTPKGTKLPLTDIKGKDYLDIKYRIIWFREVYPNGTIETQVLEKTDEYALTKATIRSDEHLLATAHRLEYKKRFFDYVEKSETSAIGRALAFIGFGTQNATDIEEGDHVADAPVPRKGEENGSGFADVAPDWVNERPPSIDSVGTQICDCGNRMIRSKFPGKGQHPDTPPSEFPFWCPKCKAQRFL